MAVEFSEAVFVKIAIVTTVVALVISMMAPVLAPAYADSDYADLYQERQELEAFTGQSMVSQTPFILTGVYTPYIQGEPYQFDESSGWLYGSKVDPYPSSGTSMIGESTNIRLDPNQKSTTLFTQDVVEPEVVQNKWYYADNILGDFWWWLAGGIVEAVTGDSSRTEVVNQQVNTWTYTGYRYQFDSQVELESGEVEGRTSDASLSIIWYDVAGQEGISGGLVVYDEINDGIVANYSAYDIISGYASQSNYASAYLLDFNDWKINMYIRFDPDVVANGTDLEEAWENGDWTVAFSADSIDGLLDINGSNSASMSIGSIITNYYHIMTFQMPNVPEGWDIVLWIICTLPLMILALFFALRILDLIPFT